MSGSKPPLSLQNSLNEANPIPRKRTARDYQFGNKIGEGSYSTVFLAVDLYNNKTYAIKVLSKKHIVKEDKIKYVNIEKTTLHRLGQQHPGIVQLYYTFQDEQSLFFALDFAEYGELLTIISKFGSLLESVLKFYMLQIIDAVKFIHLKGVIHRDLKPENILVDYNFKLKITDFGAAKLLGTDDDPLEEKIVFDSVDHRNKRKISDRKGSFVGTAEYVPPELLKYNECGFETDIWAIGCILFQFFNGMPPFKESTEYLTFEKIISVSYSYRNRVPPMVKDVVDQILVFEPEKRLTIPQIQAQPWFAGVPWNDRDFIWNRKVPRFEPYNPQAAAPKFTSAPQIKTGFNRNINKSNSNYQLHNQIQQFDYNLVPSIGTAKLFQPPTRIKKVASSAPPSQINPQNYQPSRLDVGTRPKERARNSPPLASSVGKNSWKLNSAGMNHSQNSMGTQQPNNASGKSVPNPQAAKSEFSVVQNTNSIVSYNAARIAQESSSSISQLGKQMASTRLDSPQSPKSPQARNLRQNTAFAKLTVPGKSSPKSTSPKPNVASAAAHAVSKKLPPKSVAQKKESVHQAPAPSRAQSVKFEEILSFLKPKEKIIKLDTILKLVLSNKLIDRKPGNLDIDVIETLIKRHASILLENMIPVVACVSNMARVFLIDNNLEVMMVDLTANRGGDYLIYDYDFESIVVGDEGAEEDDKEREVYGYLILELIREGGDLVLLKRFDDADRKRFTVPTQVLGKDGKRVIVGEDYGWIECLVYAKELVDKLAREVKSSQKKSTLAPKQVTKQAAAKKTSRSSSRSGNKKRQVSPETPKSTNSFAYAAAAAAHR